MGDEAAETARRGEEVAGNYEGKKDRDPRQGARDHRRGEGDDVDLLGEDAEGLDGLEFLSMAEAGEVSHVEILRTLARSAGDAPAVDLCDWALPIQERHLASVREGGVELAAGRILGTWPRKGRGPARKPGEGEMLRPQGCPSRPGRLAWLSHAWCRSKGSAGTGSMRSSGR
jgi:hypothetical protein